MDLRDLIRDRSLPRTRIRRLAKEEATRRLEAEYEETVLEDEEIAAAWPEIGLSVRVPPASTRYQYEITEPGAFMEYVREEVDLKHLLTDEEIFFFVWAGALLREAVQESENWALLKPQTGEPAHPERSWPGVVATDVEESLDRLGIG